MRTHTKKRVKPFTLFQKFVIVSSLVILVGGAYLVSNRGVTFGGAAIGLTLDTQPTLDTGLLLHWTFDGKNIGPTVLDSSGNGHNGNLIFASTPADIIFNETCTVGADTLLSNHTPDIGSSWTLAVNNSGTLSCINATGRIDISAGGSSQGEVYTADTIYPTANYIVRATATTLASGSAYSLLVCRITDTTPGSETMYIAAIKGSSALIYRVLSGSATQLASGSGAANGSVMTFTCNGSSLAIADDGVTTVSTTILI